MLFSYLTATLHTLSIKKFVSLVNLMRLYSIMCLTNWKVCGRNQSLPNLRYYSSPGLKKLNKMKKNLSWDRQCPSYLVLPEYKPETLQLTKLAKYNEGSMVTPTLVMVISERKKERKKQGNRERTKERKQMGWVQ
jgi:hypothetical protein